MEVGQNIVSNDKQTVVISVVFYFKEEEEREKKAMIWNQNPGLLI